MQTCRPFVLLETFCNVAACFLVCQRWPRGPAPQPLDGEDLRKAHTLLGCEATRGDAIGFAGRRLASTLHVLCDGTGYRTSRQPMQGIRCSSHQGYASGSYLLGLLAMIKCSICSYQCDN